MVGRGDGWSPPISFGGTELSGGSVVVSEYDILSMVLIVLFVSYILGVASLLGEPGTV